MADKKAGEEYGRTWFERGRKEIAQALPAFPDSIRVVEEPGLSGKSAEQEADKEKPKDAYQEWLDARAKEAAERQPERDEMGWER